MMHKLQQWPENAPWIAGIICGDLSDSSHVFTGRLPKKSKRIGLFHFFIFYFGSERKTIAESFFYPFFLINPFYIPGMLCVGMPLQRKGLKLNPLFSNHAKRGMT